MATGMLSATLVVHAADFEPILTSRIASRSLTLGFRRDMKTKLLRKGEEITEPRSSVSYPELAPIARKGTSW
jgi:hypothetical protein